MRNCLLIFLVLLFAGLVNAQAVLKGKVALQNSRIVTGKVTFLDGVQVVSGKSTPQVTGNKGFFKLIHPALQPGDGINLRLSHPKYEIVNTPDLTTILRSDDSNDTLRLYMCKKGEWDENVFKYYGISSKFIEEKYKSKEKQLARMAKSLDDKIKLLSLLKSEQAEELSKANEMAVNFASQNLDDASELTLKAFRLFEKGKIDQAIKVLDIDILEGNVKNGLLKKQQGEALVQMGDEREKQGIALKEKGQQMAKNADDTLKMTIQALLNLADYQMMVDSFQQAEKSMELAVLADTLNAANALRFADYLIYQNQYEKALLYIALSLRHSGENKNYGTSMMRIGRIYAKKGMDSLASVYYNKAVTVFESSPAYEVELAALYIDIGNWYISMGELNEAYVFEEGALRLYEKLVQADPQYEPLIAEVMVNLATLQKENKMYGLAEDNFKKALDIQRKYAAIDPSLYNPPLAITLNNLSNLFLVQEKSDGLIYAEEALAIRRNLAKKNPRTYEPDLAQSLISIIPVYANLNEHEKAGKLSVEVCALLRRLSSQNPDLYEPELSKSLSTAGIIHRLKKDYTKAEQLFLEALEIRKRISRSHPVYEEKVALTLFELSKCYAESGQLKNQESSLKECMLVLENLRIRDAQNLNRLYFETSCIYCSLLMKTNQKSEACKAYLQECEGLLIDLRIQDLLGFYELKAFHEK